MLTNLGMTELLELRCEITSRDKLVVDFMLFIVKYHDFETLPKGAYGKVLKAVDTLLSRIDCDRHYMEIENDLANIRDFVTGGES